MAAYLFIIFFLFILRFLVYRKSIIVGKQKRNFIILSLLPLTIISGLRNESVGADTESYKNIFLQLSQAKETSPEIERLEPAYIYLNKFISLFTAQPQWLFIIVAVFISICIGIFVYRNARDPFLATLFFITLGLFQFSLSGMRQTIAIGIILLSMEFIKQRKLLWFLIIVFIAFIFHKSAVLYIPAYFIAHNKLSIKYLISYCIFILLIVFSSNSILLGTAGFLDYNYGIEETGNGQIFFSIVFLITLFGFLLRKNIIKQNSFFPIYFNISIVSLLLWTIRLFSRTAERVTFYYMPSTYLVLEETIISIKNKNNRLFIYLLICILSIALFIYRLSRDKSITPYHFF